MITKYFKNILASYMVRNNFNMGVLFVRTVEGSYRYSNSRTSTDLWPYLWTNDFKTDYTSGIVVGTGGTAETEEDFQLESILSSGIVGTVTDVTYSINEYGDMVLNMHITVTNTGSAAITIREVGKIVRVYTSEKPLVASTGFMYVLMDRTVLEDPLVIDAGDAGIISYTITGIPVKHKTIQGVEIVPFEYGTDEQIGAMIDAAHAGKIDLQEDAGWQVGMMRSIRVAEFTGGGSVTCPEQDQYICITSFEDYNSCGCVMQFDFRHSLSRYFRLNSTSTHIGGYGSTEMYTTTLPALVDALPAWLKERLVTFSVLVSVGNRSSEIETVTGNKLALRSESEILGSAKQYSADGEGDQIEWAIWQPQAYRRGAIGDGGLPWWSRSPSASSYTDWVCFGSPTQSTKKSGTGGSYTAYALSPFGCL